MKNEILEITHCRFGVRKIEIQGDVFTINGKAVKLKGVNRHEQDFALPVSSLY